MADFINFDIDLGSLNSSNFDDVAIDIFRLQSLHNPVYNRYLKELGISSQAVRTLQDIPFLPIEFFKSHEIKTGRWLEETTFESSATSGTTRSRHLIRSLHDYHQNTLRGFASSFGNISQYTILALLPSYFENENSSLLNMMSFLISKAKIGSGFLSGTCEEISCILEEHRAEKTILWGVTSALLELASHGNGIINGLEDLIIVETGGMKGHGNEITREGLISTLRSAFGLKDIHSEYGMAELFSQAYGVNGLFTASPTMKVFIREPNDPFQIIEDSRTGGVNIVDLANIHSCSFIETKDLGRKDGNLFEILGRFDNSDIRGCNLLISTSITT